VTGVERIKLAAAEFCDPNALEGIQKILLAAQECVDPTAIPGPLKIRFAAQDGRRLGDDGAGVARIRAAAGLPADQTASLAKALGTDLDTLDGLLANLQMSLKRPPPARRVPSRPPRPTPARPAPAPSVAPAPKPAPLPFDHPVAYWNFRDRIAGDIRANRVHPTVELLVQHAATNYGVGMAEAAEWTERFLRHLRREMR
jgi:hypothetical protein